HGLRTLRLRGDRGLFRRRGFGAWRNARAPCGKLRDLPALFADVEPGQLHAGQFRFTRGLREHRVTLHASRDEALGRDAPVQIRLVLVLSHPDRLRHLELRELRLEETARFDRQRTGSRYTHYEFRWFVAPPFRELDMGCGQPDRI